MFATTAQAQTPGAAPASASPTDFLGPFLLPIALLALFYFMILRPQQRRAKDHQAKIGGIKRGDTVVLNSGVIGKVTGVGETEITVEIAPSTPVKVVKSMVSEIRAKGEPAPANDAKA